MAQLGNKLKEKMNKYLQRKNRVNKKIKSHNPETRVIINKSNMYISAQVINAEGMVLANVSDKGEKWNKTEKAFAAWKKLAEILKGKKIEKATFDRNGYLYHGRVKSFVEWLRDWWITL